jgi:hypothetical protein
MRIDILATGLMSALESAVLVTTAPAAPHQGGIEVRLLGHGRSGVRLAGSHPLGGAFTASQRSPSISSTLRRLRQNQQIIRCLICLRKIRAAVRELAALSLA